MEQEHITQIANIPVKLRIDRIDQLDNGKNIIIDYKTGKDNHIDKWLSDRPDEPQLPLYCVLDPVNTAGILFAQINLLKMKFIGLSSVDLAIKSVAHENNEDWQSQIQAWQLTLEKLGEDFLRGKAQVNPKKTVETCKHCHLHALCRIGDNEADVEVEFESS
jgi:ATP-dependent helicase/nuclease subunit B